MRSCAGCEVTDLYGLGFSDERRRFSRWASIGEVGEDVELVRYGGGGLYVLLPLRRSSAELTNRSVICGYVLDRAMAGRILSHFGSVNVARNRRAPSAESWPRSRSASRRRVSSANAWARRGSHARALSASPGWRRRRVSARRTLANAPNCRTILAL